MENKNEYFAIQATTKDGDKYLCWEEEQHLYFSEKSEGYKVPPAPTLFSNREEADNALDNIPSEEGRLDQFEKVIEAECVDVVKVTLSV